MIRISYITSVLYSFNSVRCLSIISVKNSNSEFWPTKKYGIGESTWTILLSMTVSRSQSGGMQPCWTRNFICSAVPPELAFVIAQAASLRVLNSALDCEVNVSYNCFVKRDCKPGCLSRLGKCWRRSPPGFAVCCPQWCLRWSSKPDYI